MKDPVTYFFSSLNFKRQSALFKKLLYLFVIAQCIYWLINYDLLFGENSVITTKDYEIGFFKGLAYFLYNPAHHKLCLWAILLVILLSILNLLNKKIYILFDLVTWFLVLNLHNRVYSTLTGGNYLLNQLLLFNCFISTGFAASKEWKIQLRNFLHNFGVVAVIVQVIFLYLASGLTKLNDELWIRGEALSMISQVDHYNLYNPIRYTKDSSFGMLLNYMVIFYQLLFPILIWFKKTKKIVLVFGIGIHLYIAFIMGLISFGLLMLIPYVLFWPDKTQATDFPNSN